MKAEEKAIELIGKYENYAYSDGITTINEFQDTCKQCALIAVNTYLEDLDEYHDSHYHDERISYWNNVKQEIKKL